MISKIVFLNSVILFLVGCSSISTDDKNQNFHIGYIRDYPVTVIASIEEDNYFLYPSVRIGDKILFTDSTDNLYNLRLGDNKVINLKQSGDQSYILLEISDPPLADKWVVISIRNNKLISLNKVIKDIADDLDDDGFIELGGIEVDDAFCENCDSAYYNPYTIYELSDHLKFDTFSSEYLTKKIYGVYLGASRLDTVVNILRK